MENVAPKPPHPLSHRWQKFHWDQKFCSVFFLFSKSGAQKPYEIFGQVAVSPTYLSRKTVFVYLEITFFSSVFFSRHPENLNSVIW